ncbi:unnamed protein product [Protopolystoma xenopodis]|uniref:Uncharacterized protein n=1 Tax=Protopolystoma xenopodis TaxID=117903 RepID=A0A3S5A084_9PLAT|nr:unnamed protein product [Protopolystoma xenopodis]
MAALTDDADYDSGETFRNVPSPRSDVGTRDNYYGRRLRTRCVLHSRHDNKTKLRQRAPFQPNSSPSQSSGTRTHSLSVQTVRHKFRLTVFAARTRVAFGTVAVHLLSVLVADASVQAVTCLQMRAAIGLWTQDCGCGQGAGKHKLA